MRLHRLALRDFRGVADRTVDLPPSGTTVIAGDNEVGKSSLIEALVLLFDLPDDSRAQRVRAVQPVGRDVGPEVAAEVSLGEHRLSYRKRWLRSRVTELTVTGPSGSAAYTGREGHDEAARLFEQHVDPVLWQTLMVGQGTALVLPTPADAEPLIAAVTAESGTPLDGGSMPLVTAVEQEYLRYWTKTGRPTGDFARTATALADAETAVEQAKEGMDAVAADVRKAERLTQELADLRVRLDRHSGELAELETEAQHAETLLSRRDAVMAKADLARARLENCTRIRTERDRLLADLDRWSGEVTELETLRDEAEQLAKESTTEAHRAQATYGEACEERDTKRAAVQVAEQAVARLADQAELDRLTERQRELAAVRARIATAQAGLDGIAITDDLLAELETAHGDLVEARAAVAATAPSIVVRRLGAATVTLSDDTELSDGESVERVVDDEFRVVVPGHAEVSVRAGGEVMALRATADQAAQRERELLARSGATDLAAARELLRRRDLTAAELAEARRTERALGDPAEQIALLTARLTTDTSPEDVGGIELAEARQGLAAAELAVTDAEFAGSQARKAAEQDRATAQQVATRLELAADRARAVTDALAAARGAGDDQQVLADEQAATGEVERVVAELTAIEDLVAESGADRLPERLADARQVRDQLRHEHEQQRDQLRLTEGRLEQSGRDGMASRLDEAELTRERARDEHERLRRRADAARRVHETLTRHRTAAQTRYAAPLRERIETLGRSVYGPSFKVALDNDLTVSERELNGVRLSVDALSTGAKEQLAIITRLAIAHLVGKGAGSVPAIIDDALGWSDKARLRDMGALLGRAGEHGQVIVLTCLPERYEYVPGATFLRLD